MSVSQQFWQILHAAAACTWLFVAGRVTLAHFGVVDEYQLHWLVQVIFCVLMALLGFRWARKAGKQ